MIESIVVLV